MGKPVPNYISGDLTRKMMPIGVVMDERLSLIHIWNMAM